MTPVNCWMRLRLLSILLGTLSLVVFPLLEGESRMRESHNAVAARTEQGLQPLFTAVLQYQQEARIDPVNAARLHDGAYIGSGDGVVTGKTLHGKIRWSLWSGDCVYPLVRKGQAIPEGLHLCTMNPSGVIETDDGARIGFEGRGYGLRGSRDYRTSLTLVFSTEDVRYGWLNETLGVMEGKFYEQAGQANWNVYVPVKERLTTKARRAPEPGP